MYPLVQNLIIFLILCAVLENVRTELMNYMGEIYIPDLSMWAERQR